jgi:peptidoglycan hydrolase-like protein with peptidoglycan-binding domain
MRNALRRIAIGAAGTGMAIAMAAGPAALTADAAVSAHSPAAAAAAHQPKLIWPVVKFGDSGPRVYTVQYLLDEHGHKLVADGKFGVLTRFAVKLFQKSNGLSPSGKVGAKTWQALITGVWRGSTGDAVMAAQAQLRHVYGYHFVAVDGVFGPLTELAVILFQKKHGLPADGIVGRNTWNALVVHDM